MENESVNGTVAASSGYGVSDSAVSTSSDDKNRSEVPKKAERKRKKLDACARRTIIIVLVSLLVMILWGALFPFVKYGYKVFSIDTTFYPNLILFAGVRFTISGFILSLFCIFTKRTYIVRQPKKLIGTSLVALFAVVLHYTCTYIGLCLVDAGKTALLKQSGVVVFVCISFLFFKEDEFSWGKIAGAVLGVASVLVVNFESTKFDFGLGSILIIAASLCTVINNVVFKKTLGDVNPVSVTGYSQFIGGVILLVIGLCFGGSFGTVTWGGAGIMVFIVAATVVSYGLWYAVVQKYSLSKLFIIKMTEPLFAAMISVLLPIGATLTWQHGAAFALVVAAVLVSNVNFGKKPRKTDETATINDETAAKPQNGTEVKFDESNVD